MRQSDPDRALREVGIQSYHLSISRVSVTLRLVRHRASEGGVGQHQLRSESLARARLVGLVRRKALEVPNGIAFLGGTQLFLCGSQRINVQDICESD